MGTNYYAVMEAEEVICPTCGRDGHVEQKRLHIGKSSYGWCFSLHVGSAQEPHIPRSLAAWREVWKTAVRLENEYGETISTEEMERIITQRSHPGGGQKDRSWFVSNYATPGPNNLARHSIKMDNHCVGHGDGTWDLITGQFS